MTNLQRRPVGLNFNATNQGAGILSPSSGVVNWNDSNMNWVFPMWKQLTGNTWFAEEVNMSDDVKQWGSLEPHEQDTFKKIIGLLASLDSIQADYCGEVSSFIGNAHVSSVMKVIEFQEVIHNQSYSKVLSALVPEEEQQRIFDMWKTDEVIKKHNEFIFSTYREFDQERTVLNFAKSIVKDIVLEGMRFYVAFAFFYNLAREGKMTKTNEMINFINRDENLHVRVFSYILNELKAEYPELLSTDEFEDYVYDTIKEAVKMEHEWADYIVGDRFEGIDLLDLKEYVEFTANKRLMQMGYDKAYEAENTLPWIKYFEDVNSAKQDFFEGKVRQYSKANDFDDLD